MFSKVNFPALKFYDSILFSVLIISGLSQLKPANINISFNTAFQILFPPRCLYFMKKLDPLLEYDHRNTDYIHKNI